MATSNPAWHSNARLRWTFVHGDTVTDCLRQLADTLEQYDLERWVSHLHLNIEDDGLTVSALTELPPRGVDY